MPRFDERFIFYANNYGPGRLASPGAFAAGVPRGFIQLWLYFAALSAFRFHTPHAFVRRRSPRFISRGGRAGFAHRCRARDFAQSRRAFILAFERGASSRYFQPHYFLADGDNITVVATHFSAALLMGFSFLPLESPMARARRRKYSIETPIDFGNIAARRRVEE